MSYVIGYSYPIEATISGDDLTGATAVIVYQKPKADTTATAPASVDALAGVIRYTLPSIANDTVGRFRFKFDITKNGNTTPTEWAEVYFTEE